MKTISLAFIISAALACSVVAKEKKHEEQLINSSDIPAAVQKTADNEAKGGKIVRWEKEGGDYEAVISKGGKEWGVKIDGNGKVVSKHDESREKGEH